MELNNFSETSVVPTTFVSSFEAVLITCVLSFVSIVVPKIFPTLNTSPLKIVMLSGIEVIFVTYAKIIKRTIKTDEIFLLEISTYNFKIS